MTASEEKIQDALKEFRMRRDAGDIPAYCELMRSIEDDGMPSAGYPSLREIHGTELREVMTDFVGLIHEDLNDTGLQTLVEHIASGNF